MLQNRKIVGLGAQVRSVLKGNWNRLKIFFAEVFPNSHIDRNPFIQTENGRYSHGVNQSEPHKV